MISLKYLVIGIANDFQILINKSFMNGYRNGIKMNLCFQIFKNGMQSFQLFWIFSKKINLKFFRFPLLSDPLSANQTGG